MPVQPVLFDVPEVDPPSADGSCAGLDEKARGAVFTKPAVVEFMLDLAGYTEDAPLYALHLLEPSCGSGSFLLPAARRLLHAWKRGGEDDTVLDDAVRAVELDARTFRGTQRALTELLIAEGVSELSVARIVRKWLVNEDFLTTSITAGFDVVVGNPPYIRQELVPPGRLALYRRSYPTMVGRADVYVAFFERSLDLLKPSGKLCFICADAWTRNDYGRELRRLVTDRYALRVYVDMYGLDAFETDVGAYPSITLIERRPAGPVRTARASSTDPEKLTTLAASLTSGGAEVRTLPALASGGGPWLLRGGTRQEAVRLLEQRCPTLEDAGCRVGIGVATGADRVFVGPYEDLPVEDDRKLPLAINKDVGAGQFNWHGMGVLNPWNETGGLVDLGAYPRLAAYLRPHRERLAARHTAKADPDRRWYKTIDRITASLTWQPKLLIPDIRGDGDAIAYDDGTVYPHHNLYHITSNLWDLRALQALLRSGLAHLFVDAYAVKIGGGYLRFQAQYLRRIRIPRWDALSHDQQDELVATGTAGTKLIPSAVEAMCGLDAGCLSFMEEWQ